MQYMGEGDAKVVGKRSEIYDLATYDDRFLRGARGSGHADRLGEMGMTTITHHDDGSVTATDPATGIESKCRADEASPEIRVGIARRRLTLLLRQHALDEDNKAVQRGME